MHKDPKVLFRPLAHGADLPLPAYETERAAGMDLRAAEIDGADAGMPAWTICPGERVKIRTGLEIAIEAGYEGQIRPRSGLALRHGVTVLNSPGTVDSDYRGEIMVLLVNLGAAPSEIRRGDRIAQLVITPVARAVVERVADLPDTSRGACGFGSTGTK